MSISREDCHENARLCTELAKTAVTPEHAQVLRNFAKQWLKLARELEGTDTVLIPKPLS
jgi:hypothetical protein